MKCASWIWSIQRGWPNVQAKSFSFQIQHSALKRAPYAMCNLMRHLGYAIAAKLWFKHARSTEKYPQSCEKYLVTCSACPASSSPNFDLVKSIECWISLSNWNCLIQFIHLIEKINGRHQVSSWTKAAATWQKNKTVIYDNHYGYLAWHVKEKVQDGIIPG